MKQECLRNYDSDTELCRKQKPCDIYFPKGKIGKPIGKEKLTSSKDRVKTVAIATSAVVLLIIIFFMLSSLRFPSSPPPMAEPEVLSWHTEAVLSWHTQAVRDEYVVYASVINNGENGWVKIIVSGTSWYDNIGFHTHTQTRNVYLRHGETTTIQAKLWQGSFEITVTTSAIDQP